jgi:hypothetical protein
LTYVFPDRAEPPEVELLRVSVIYPDQLLVALSSIREHAVCIPSTPLEAVDSDRLMRDSIRALEAAGYEIAFETGGTWIDLEGRHPCAASDLAFPIRATYGNQRLYFDAEGTPLGLEVDERERVRLE